MITILLVNLIGVSIYVAGVGLCLRTTKRTGNIGYLLLAGYFAAVLVVSSMEQVEKMQKGPTDAEYSEAVAEPEKDQLGAPEAKQEALPDAAEQTAPQLPGDSSSPEKDEETQVKEQVAASDSPWEGVTLPILPALLLAGVSIVSRDDPRRRQEAETEAGPDEAKEEPSPGREDEVEQG